MMHTRFVAPNKYKFDCRHYILPGDIIQYESMKACDGVNNVDRYTSIRYEAPVVAVHEQFVIVKLKRIYECVNRWDISKINGRSIGSGSGYFGGLIARA